MTHIYKIESEHVEVYVEGETSGEALEHYHQCLAEGKVQLAYVRAVKIAKLPDGEEFLR